MMALLQIKNFSVNIANRSILKNISLTLQQGETLALIGESGAGKSMSANAIMRLLPNGSTNQGDIFFEGNKISSYSQKNMCKIRGNKIALISQNPLHSLNPLQTIHTQLRQAISLHRDLSRKDLEIEISYWLKKVSLEEIHLPKLPYQLSGGQCQRTMIAMALSNRPQLLIADEPTTALDVSLQAQILNLLHNLQQEMGMACLFITHNFDIMHKIANHIAVMHQGEIIEQGKYVLTKPQQPYTKLLLSSRLQPRKETTQKTGPKNLEPLLQIKNLSVKYHPPTSIFQKIFRKTSPACLACDQLNFSLQPGACLGIVGQSGSGKSSLAKALLRLIPAQGDIIFAGNNLAKITEAELKPYRRDLQIIFQQPATALSPRMKIGDIIGEGLDIHKLTKNRSQRYRKIIAAMETVNLNPELYHHYAYQLSGGQNQRVAIARILILQPKLLILDEPTASLDLYHQAQILTLLGDLQTQQQLSYIFISHDIKIIRAIAHHVLVMHQGKIIESGDTETVFNAPKTDYTQQLINAAYLYSA